MKKITFSFTGRQSGAIGIFYKIQDTYKCNSVSEAKSMLWNDYEHISGLKIVKGCTQKEYDGAAFIDVESHSTRRTRDIKGSYLYTRSDSEI